VAFGASWRRRSSLTMACHPRKITGFDRFGLAQNYREARGCDSLYHMLATNTSGDTSLKQRRMARTKAEIQRCALKLFRKQGFEETTVNQIAAAAEVSPMTVFRYFATKEDIALWDDFDQALVAQIRRASRNEDVITLVSAVLLTSLAEAGEEARMAMLARLELAARTPALRARGLDNLYQTQQIVASALGSANKKGQLRNSVAVGACLVAISSALFQWAMGQGKDDPVALAREAFIVIGAKLGGEQNEPRKIRNRRR
jgi:AcrR family transcriptional regulator